MFIANRFLCTVASFKKVIKLVINLFEMGISFGFLFLASENGENHVEVFDIWKKQVWSRKTSDACAPSSPPPPPPRPTPTPPSSPRLPKLKTRVFAHSNIRRYGRTDRLTDGRPTDGRPERPSYRDAWTHLKT